MDVLLLQSSLEHSLGMFFCKSMHINLNFYFTTVKPLGTSHCSIPGVDCYGRATALPSVLSYALIDEVDTPVSMESLQ